MLFLQHLLCYDLILEESDGQYELFLILFNYKGLLLSSEINKIKQIYSLILRFI